MWREAAIATLGKIPKTTTDVSVLALVLAGGLGGLLLATVGGDAPEVLDSAFAAVIFGFPALGFVYHQLHTAPATLEVHYGDAAAAARIDAFLAGLPLSSAAVKIFCVGCGAIAGDSFGPLVGNHLAGRNHCAYGTTDAPLNALTLPDRIGEIVPDDYIIVVDAVIGTCHEQEGMLCLKAGPVRPGSALGKKLPPIGHLSILFTASVFRPGDPLAEFFDTAASGRCAAAAALVAAAIDRRLQAAG